MSSGVMREFFVAEKKEEFFRGKSRQFENDFRGDEN